MIQGFGEEKQKELVRYLEDEVIQTNNDRSTLLLDLQELNDMYEGRLIEKNFPWEGCSNIQVPLISTHVDAIHANFMNSVFMQDPFWAVRSLTPNGYGVAKRTERFMQYGSEHVWKMYDVCQDWFKFGITDGTGIIDLNWKEEYRWVYNESKSGDGNVEYFPEPKLMYRGPKICSIPLENFYIPNRYPELHSAPWCGHDFFLSWPELVGQEQLGFFKNTKKIKEFPDAQPTDQDMSRAAGSGIDLSQTSRIYKIRRMITLWDVKNDNKFVPIEIYYHPEHLTVLNVRYYPYKHGRWNYFVFRYLRKKKSFYGIGVPHMLRYLQTGLDDIVNQTIDSGSIANTRYYKMKKTAVEGPQSIFPGAQYWMDNPREDMIAEQLGSTYPDITNFVANMERWAQGRDAMSEDMMGQPSSILKTKGTATATVAHIQQSRGRMEASFKDVRQATQELGYQILELYQQFTDAYEWLTPEAQSLDDLQRVTWTDDAGNPIDYRDTLIIELSATRNSLNKPVEQANLLNLKNIMDGYYKQLVEFTMMMAQAPPDAKQTLYEIAEASRILTIRILDTFDLPEAEKLVPKIGDPNAVPPQPPMGPDNMVPPGAPVQGIPGAGGAGIAPPPGADVGGIPQAMAPPGGNPMG